MPSSLVASTRQCKSAKSASVVPKKRASPATGKRRTANKNKSSSSSNKSELSQKKGGVSAAGSSSKKSRKIQEPRTCAIELNSSPIKIKDELSSISDKYEVSMIKRKSVMFSDDLVSESPSSPDKCLTPKRSILKPCDSNSVKELVDPSNTKLWENSNKSKSYGPQNPSFWLQGTVVQITTNAAELPLLVEGCLSVLTRKSFTLRFEVYATLNGICKSNSNSTLLHLFTQRYGDFNETSTRVNSSSTTTTTTTTTSNVERTLPTILEALTEQAIKDIQEMESQIFNERTDKENPPPLAKNDPFQVRAVNQALKLLSFFMSAVEFTNRLSIECIEWIYLHSSYMLTQPRISKNLVSPYLTLIKEFNLDPVRKNALFENNELIERMIFAIVNSNTFASVSLLSEKFLCIRNYLTNFPKFMANHVDYWFQVLLVNLCNITPTLFSRWLPNGVQCLLEAAKLFLDNLSVQSFVKKLLTSTALDSIKSLSSNDTFVLHSDAKSLTHFKLIDCVISRLKELIHVKQYTLAMDMWMSLTMLVGNGEAPFEQWEYLNEWLEIPRYCFNSQDQSARLLAINCWKAVCFNVCKNEMGSIKKELELALCSPKRKRESNPLNQATKLKIKLLTHMFCIFDISMVDTDVANALHNLFLRILYPMVSLKMIRHAKYLHILWVKVIQSILVNFYFKKGVSNAYSNELGLQVLTKLVSPIGNAANDKCYNELKILSQEEISLNEINSIPSKWIHAHFDVVMQNLILVSSSQHLQFDSKLAFYVTFLNAIRPVIKREQVPSATTFDIVDNLPIVIKELLDGTNPTYKTVYKIVLTLNDTFEPSLLVRRANAKNDPEGNVNVYLSILKCSIGSLSITEQEEILSLIIRSLKSTKRLIFIADFLKLADTSNELHSFLARTLEQGRIDTQIRTMNLYGEICRTIRCSYETITKMLMQTIISLSCREEMHESLVNLQIELWETNKANYVLLLLKDSPCDTVNQFIVDAIIHRLKSGSSFEMLNFLAKYDFLNESLLETTTELLFYAIKKLDPVQYREACFLLEAYLKEKCTQIDRDCKSKVIDNLASGCSRFLGMNVDFVFSDCSSTKLQQQQQQQQQSSSSPPKVRSKEASLGSRTSDFEASTSFLKSDESPETSGCLPSCSLSIIPRVYVGIGTSTQQDLNNIDVSKEKNTVSSLVNKVNSPIAGSDSSSSSSSNTMFSISNENELALQDKRSIEDTTSDEATLAEDELPSQVNLTQTNVQVSITGKESQLDTFCEDDSFIKAEKVEEELSSNRILLSSKQNVKEAVGSIEIDSLTDLNSEFDETKKSEQKQSLEEKSFQRKRSSSNHVENPSLPSKKQKRESCNDAKPHLKSECPTMIGRNKCTDTISSDETQKASTSPKSLPLVIDKMKKEESNAGAVVVSPDNTICATKLEETTCTTPSLKSVVAEETESELAELTTPAEPAIDFNFVLNDIGSLKLVQLLSQIPNNELSKLNNHDAYEMETQLLKFMIKLRESRESRDQ
ncbi:RIF1 [Candida oxycetoniae]|uniref:RIF1 n=1 Tax=Candida oxycetoniae TaxID=497107 RepID=A0AAI9WZJ2_9ASCO|nr:RIF1 [Candida oxycetoniae]KAI3406427.2 RIF1 [Candida oxycetoniae]